MVYLDILIGLGVVLVSAAAAIYFSQPTYQHTQPYRHRRRNENDDDSGEVDNGKRLRRQQKTTKIRRNEDDDDAGEDDNGKKLQRHFTQEQKRRSEPDKCPVCLGEMSQEDMHKMVCGHALHKKCFEVYRFIRRDCPLCKQIVNPTLPGDNCTFCMDPLEKCDMVFLRCNHAMHQLCYKLFIESAAKFCQHCGEKLHSPEAGTKTARIEERAQ